MLNWKNTHRFRNQLKNKRIISKLNLKSGKNKVIQLMDEINKIKLKTNTRKYKMKSCSFEKIHKIVKT